MEDKKSKVVNLKERTKEVKPTDGIVSESQIYETKFDTHGKFIKGNVKVHTYTTNDPSITRPFVNGVCLVFFVTGIILLFVNMKIMGIIFIISSIMCFIKMKMDIDKVEKSLKETGNYDNTKETKKEARAEFVNELKKGWEDSKNSVFTKDNYKHFVKTTLPIYCIITLVVSGLLAYGANLILGLIVGVICIISGLLFYGFVSLICKK